MAREHSTDARRARRFALIRVTLLGTLVTGLVLALLISGNVPTADDVRDAGDDTGSWAVLLYVPAFALLTSLFTFVPVMAGAAGLLFGAALGTPLAIAGLTAAACLQMAISRYLAGRHIDSILPDRVRRVDEFLERRGFFAVLYARLAPAMPFVFINYGAGLTKLGFWSMAAGTAVGGAPRAWAWVVLGGRIDDLGSPEAKAAIAMLVVIGVAGFVLARRQIRTEREAP